MKQLLTHPLPFGACALALASLAAPGCSAADEQAASLKAAEENESTARMLVVTPSAIDKDGVIARLADTGSARLGSPNLNELNGSVSAVLVDLAELPEAEVPHLKLFATAATRQGIPVLVENVANSAAMARTFGVGIDAKTVVLRSDASGQYRRIQVVSDASSATVSAVTSETETAAPLALESAPANARQDPEATAERVRALLEPSGVGAAGQGTALGQVEQAFSAPGCGDLPIDKCQQTIVAHDPTYWHLTYGPTGGTQEFSATYGYRVNTYWETYSDNAYIRVTPIGTGLSTGTLLSNHNERRVFYTNRVDVQVCAASGALPVDHEPKTELESGEYSTSTGWDAGVDSSGTVSLGYSSSNTSTVTYEDFEVQDVSSGTCTSWESRMNRHSGGSYNSYWDLDYFTGWSERRLRGLPDLATGNFYFEYEALFVDNNADDHDLVHLTMSDTHQVAHNRISGSWPSERHHAGAWRHTRSHSVSIDTRPIPSSELLADIPLSEVTGIYRHLPVENGYHDVLVQSNGDALTWSNRAGVSWGANYDDGMLEWLGSPYGYAQTFVALKRGWRGNLLPEVRAIRWENVEWERIGDLPVPTQAELEGVYHRLPIENDWHDVRIESNGSGSYTWSNAAGWSWDASSSGQQLVWASSSPYGTVELDMALGFAPDGSVTLEGLRNGPDLYTRVSDL